MGLTRRQAIGAAGAAISGVVGLSAPALITRRALAAAPFERPALPFAPDALEPHISQRTVEIHSAIIHQRNVDQLNALVADTPYAAMSLTDIIASAERDFELEIFHAASETYAHTLYFEALAGGLSPMGPVVEEAMAREFGGLNGFVEQAIASAERLLGGGWLWLTAEGDGLFLEAWEVSGGPAGSGRQALLAIDLWEHAYFLDYETDQAAYLSALLTELVNWGSIEQRYIDG